MIWAEKTTSSEGLDLPQVLAILMRRKWLILFFAVLGTSLATLGYLDQPARYHAESVLALNVRKLQALPTEAVISSLPQESPVLRTEVDVIGSRSMAEKVLAGLQAEGFDVGANFGLPAQVPDNVQPGGATWKSKRAEREGTRERALVDHLMSGVRVTNDGRSYTIYISFSCASPGLAAAVANAYAEAYIDYQVDVQTSATRRVSDWLGARLVNLRSELERSEHAATSFREKSGIVKSNGTTLLSQQIGGLNAELANLRAELAGSVARLSTALDVSNSKGGLALPEVLNSAAIQQLRTEEARVKRLLAQISESGAVKNPQIPQLTSELETLRAQIGIEVEQIVDSLRNEIEVGKRQQSGLEASLRQLQAEMSKANEAIVEADQLDREASANRAIYESYLARYKQTIEQDGMATPEARIITRAVPSGLPAGPNLRVWLLGGLLFGLAAGLAATVALEVRRTLLRGGGEDESEVGIPVVGRIPELAFQQRGAASDLIRHGRSQFAHAIAEVQTRLRLACRTSAVPVIAVTSAEVGEGKTLVAACLARSLAATGMRTILVDANLHAPGVAQELGIHPAHTVDEVAGHDLPLDDLVCRDMSSGVDAICAHSVNVPAEQLLGNEGFTRLVCTLRRSHDIVIVDSPSVSTGSGALVVSSLADSTVLVVPEGADPMRTAHAVRKLKLAGGVIAGVIANTVPRMRPARRNVVSIFSDHILSPTETRRQATTGDTPSIAIT